MTDDATPRTIRRPRMTPEREEELLRAAIDALREVGYEALTMDLVAARGQCSKATLYKTWESKPRLVAAALRATRPHDSGAIDTGTLRGDLIALAGIIGEGSREDATLFHALGHAALLDDSLNQAMRSLFLDPEKENLERIVRRAVERGELPERPAATDFLPQMLIGVAALRPFTEGVFADDAYLRRFVDTALLPALLDS